MNSTKHNVAVIVATYNPEWGKLRATLDSILVQKDINFQVIVADDGSEQKYIDKIAALFDVYQFEFYNIVDSHTNMGTCYNLHNAVKYINAKYVKTIAPGDLLFNDTCLKNWFDYMEKTNAIVTYGQALYYNIQQDKYVLHKVFSSPTNNSIYRKGSNRRKVFVDYLLANDTILGAAMMIRSEQFLYYLSMIVGKVKYAEDYMIRLMVFEGNKIEVYLKDVVWYEYGTGISTSNNMKWIDLLHRDFEECNKIIETECKCYDYLSRQYKYILKKKGMKKYNRHILKLFLFPDILYWRMKACLLGDKTNEMADMTFIKNIYDLQNKLNS